MVFNGLICGKFGSGNDALILLGSLKSLRNPSQDI